VSGVTIVGDLSQPATAQQVPAHGQPAPVIIAQPEAPSPQLTSKDAILFDQIREGLLLPLILPADQRDKKQPQRKTSTTAGESISPTEIRSPKAVGPSYETFL
jgi:hypothetical protein